MCFELKWNCEGAISILFHPASIKAPERSYREGQVPLLQPAGMVCVPRRQDEASVAFPQCLLWQIQYLVSEAKTHCTTSFG